MQLNFRAKIFISRKSLCTSISMFLVLISVSIQAYTQVTISAKNITLDQAFDQLSNQTGFTFFYNSKDIRKLGKIDVALKGVSLETALGQLLKGLPLSWHVVDKTVVIRATTPSNVQDTIKEISGTVRNRLSEPLPRVSIRILNEGYQTNNDGEFKIRVTDEDAPISFSFIGYRTAVYKAGQAKNGKLNIVLEDAKIGLNEVVVNGYQEIRQDNYTGTAVVVSGEKLKELSPQNLLLGMQMVDPSFKILNNNFNGSNPNSLPVINVRGSSALPTSSDGILRRDNITSSVNSPAFILDGYEVSLEKVYDLDMNRIASVTLLKDAAATAIYGSRAANGVLVITTKMPANGRLQVTYNHETNVNGPDLTDYHVLNATQKLQYELQAGVYDAGQQGGVSQDDLDEQYYEKLKNVVGGVNTYWLSQPVRTAVGQKHGLYLQGGAENFRYGIDLRYQTRPGVMIGSSRNQYSGGMNFNYNLSNRIKFQNELTITQVKAKESPYGSFSDYVKTNPYYRITDDNGTMLRELETWSDRNGSGGSYQYDYVLNPLYNSTLSSFDNNTYTEIIDNFSAEFEITKGLRLRGQMSLTSRQTNGDNFLSLLANEFYFYAASETDEKGSYTSSKTKETNWDGNIRLNYVKELQDHSINLVGGANIRTELSDYSSYTAIGFSNDRFTSLGFAKGYAEGAHPSSSIEKSRLFGGFISTNYSYKDRYLMDATARTDGSSKFGTNNRLAPFWSFGVGWNLHKEEWFSNTAISQLKLRFTTGLTGSVQFSSYLSRTTYNYDQDNWYSTGIGATVNNYGNENLGWQKTRSTDIGFDLGLFNNRIFISPRVYRKLTKDLLADISIAPSTGFTTYKENLGDMENKGIELSVRLTVVQNKDWSVNLYANLVHNTNKIVRISNSLDAYNDKVDQEQTDNGDYKGVPLLRYKEGQSYDAIYAVRSLGIDPENGKEVFEKQDGTLTYQWDAHDVRVVGDATPFAQGSFGGSFRYKKFMMSLNFQTEFGGDMYNQTLVDRVENANPRYNVDSRVLEEKWKKPGDKTFYKSITDWGETQVSSRFIQPNNVLSLQSLYCSYDLRVIKRTAQLGLTANDLLRWSSVEQERGIDYPFARSITISLQVQF